MESGELDVGPEDRTSSGPLVLVDDEDSQGGYADLVEHVPLDQALKDAVAKSARGVDFTNEVVILDPSAPLIDATYEDAEGRWWKVRVPSGSQTPVHMGIPVGPPDVSELGLPFDVSVRLHNQLFNRGLFTKRDLHRRGQEVFAAIQAAYRVDSQAVTALYR